MHQPRLLLLDEPSIGLDVIAKQRLRDTLRVMNELERVTILLTSHDTGDLEALCKRVIIINQGQIVYQDEITALRRRYLTTKVVEVQYRDEVSPRFQVEGTEILEARRYGVKLSFDLNQTEVKTVLARLAAAGDLIDVTITDPSLEQVIGAVYQEHDP